MLARGFTGSLSPSVRPHLHAADFGFLVARGRGCLAIRLVGMKSDGLTVLTVRGLHHRYPDGTQALNGIDFRPRRRRMRRAVRRERLRQNHFRSASERA